MGKHLKIIAQRYGRMVRLCGKELIVIAAAVADPVTGFIKGNARHQHQGRFIIRHRLIGDRLGNAHFVFFHFTQVI